MKKLLLHLYNLPNHLLRCILSLRGFRYLGRDFFWIWILYVVNPILGRIFKVGIINLCGFKLRMGESDIISFANIFVDYDPEELKKALQEVDVVIDAGANIGAFSFLVRLFSKDIEIIAIEPVLENVAFLNEQSFSNSLTIMTVGLARAVGTGKIEYGDSNAIHRAYLSEDGSGDVRFIDLSSIANRRALLKLDIEGAEKEILNKDLNANIRCMFFEWHYPGIPELPEGELRLIKSDPMGASCWFWRRNAAS